MSCNCGEGDYYGQATTAAAESDTESVSESESSDGGAGGGAGDYEQRRHSAASAAGYKAPSGKTYPKRLGTREEVYHGKAYKTSGGLVAGDIERKTRTSAIPSRATGKTRTVTSVRYVSKKASVAAKDRYSGSKFAAEVEKRRAKHK